MSQGAELSGSFDESPSLGVRSASVFTWLLLATLTVVVTATAISRSFARYDAFRSGWSWDLAYYDQWFRALNSGGEISVRPVGPWTVEGPSPWRANYVSPIRFAIAPIARMFPGPKFLLVLNCLAIGLAIPASFGLVWSEARSNGLALSAASLVPLTPLYWPLAMNDFRELQLALPFVLWGVQGVRSRNFGLAVLGVGGMLACRQEFAVMVASLAILPPRDPEGPASRLSWCRTLGLVGAGWLVFGFLVPMKWAVHSRALEIFLEESRSGRVPPAMALRTTLEFLIVGIGSWAILACLVPREALLVLPWAWGLGDGRWALSFLATDGWHHVRYTAPMVAITLAAGCLGYARLGTWLKRQRHGAALLAMAWITIAAGLIVPGVELRAMWSRAPTRADPEEAAELWRWFDRVGPRDGVLVTYDLAAPLASRPLVFSYHHPKDRLPEFPRLPPELSWAFLLTGSIGQGEMEAGGFTRVHDGPAIEIYRRPPALTLPRTVSEMVTDRSNGVSRISALPRDQPMDWGYRLGLIVLGMEQVGWVAILMMPAGVVAFWARRRSIGLRNLDATSRGMTGKQYAVEAGFSPSVADGPFADDYDAVAHRVQLATATATGSSLEALLLASLATAHAEGHRRGDRLERLHMPLAIASRTGRALGILAILGGAALASWMPVHRGVLLVSVATVVPWLVLTILGRRAVPEVVRGMVKTGLMNERERGFAVLAADAQAARHARIFGDAKD